MTISDYSHGAVDTSLVEPRHRRTGRHAHGGVGPSVPSPAVAYTKPELRHVATIPADGSRRRNRASVWTIGFLDLLGVVAGLALAGVPWAIFDHQGPQRLSMLAPLRTELPYIVLYLLTFTAYGLYRRERRRLRHDWFVDASHLFHACAAAALGTMVLSAAMYRSAGWRAVHPFEAALVTCSVFLLVGGGRSLRAALQAHRGVLRARVAVVGSGPVARRVAASLGAFDDVRMVGFIDDPLDGADHLASPLLGGISELDQLCDTNAIDRLIVAVSDARTPAVVDALRTLPQGVQVSVVPRLYELITPRSTIEEVHGINLIDVAPPSRGYVQLFLKRAIDVVGSLSLIILLGPAMIACAIAIRINSPGPALFKQPRAGRHGKPFTLLKFRSMREGAEDGIIDLRSQSEVDGPLFKLREDPRVTAVGRFLRATSLDELPQLFNVLVGQMSLVGPRPFVLAEAQEIDGWAAKRFTVRPGMTGLWQVSGRSDLPFEDLRHLDYAYVASWSLWWDLRILAKTPPTVLARRGAY